MNSLLTLVLGGAVVEAVNRLLLRVESPSLDEARRELALGVELTEPCLGRIDIEAGRRG